MLSEEQEQRLQGLVDTWLPQMDIFDGEHRKALIEELTWIMVEVPEIPKELGDPVLDLVTRQSSLPIAERPDLVPPKDRQRIASLITALRGRIV